MDVGAGEMDVVKEEEAVPKEEPTTPGVQEMETDRPPTPERPPTPPLPAQIMDTPEPPKVEQNTAVSAPVVEQAKKAPTVVYQPRKRLTPPQPSHAELEAPPVPTATEQVEAVSAPVEMLPIQAEEPPIPVVADVNGTEVVHPAEIEPVAEIVAMRVPTSPTMEVDESLAHIDTRQASPMALPVEAQLNEPIPAVLRTNDTGTNDTDAAMMSPVPPVMVNTEHSVVTAPLPVLPAKSPIVEAAEILITGQQAPSDVMLASDDIPVDAATVDSPSTEVDVPVARPPDRLPERRIVETRTLAERRSVQLPSTASPLPPSLVHSDAVLTAASVQESTDTEAWPGHVDEKEVDEEVRETKIIATVKSAQATERQLDAEAIMAWNIQVSPIKSTRTSLSRKELQEITRSIDTGVSRMVAIQVAKEQVQNERRIQRLRAEYLLLDEEWQEHCRVLDELMDARGPPPESLYSIPNALPVMTPGPMPSTAAAEEIGPRARRRGGMADAVNTEAEFQEILAGLADHHAKDPAFRASRTTAIVPDMLTPRERQMRHVDENDLVEDPIAFYDFAGDAEPEWTTEERDLFKKRYLNYPKQFGKIADGIPDKTAGQCVLYYYRTKKDENWKGQLAARRGMSTQKRKAPIIKKGGKSAALLANLDQKKPTVVSTPVKPAMAVKNAAETPAASAEKAGRRKPKEARRKSALATPVDIAEGDEVPDMKKVRTKTKRPRTSTMPEQAITDPQGPVDPAAPTVPGSTELLPPVKRRKHRKVMAEPEIGPDGQPIQASADRPAGAKRGSTSYWTAPEKLRVEELIGIYKNDYKTIANLMPDKSERQILNYMQKKPTELGLEPGDVSTTLPLHVTGH